MKVNMEVIDDKLKTGFFSSVPIFRLVVSAEFSEEEKVAIKKAGIVDQIFLYYPLHSEDEFNRRVFNGDEAYVTVENLLKNSGCKPYYLTQLAANNAMEEIAGIFRNLKDNINAISAPKTKSLEL